MPSFKFEGRSIEFREGDTIAAALYRAGVRVFSRSFKYHRPRGLYCLTGDCPNCLMTVDGEPATRTCTRAARAGCTVKRENGWPSVDFDLMSLVWHLRCLLRVGWYYKTMIRPQATWRLAEPAIRRAAGLAKIPMDLPESRKPAIHHNVDVLVAGGGPAGLSAAVAAAEMGATVLVADEGGLGEKLPPGAAKDAVGELASWLHDKPGVTLLEHAPVIGIYEGGLVPVAAAEALHLAYAGRIVVASGAMETHTVFDGNDLPGVWLGRGAARLAACHGVAPARRAVVVGLTSELPEHISALRDAGVKIIAVVAPSALEGLDSDIEHIADGEIVAARGRKRLRGVTIRTSHGDETVDIACDGLMVSASLTPRDGLLRQAPEANVVGAGEVVAPDCTLDAAIESGRRAALGGNSREGATSTPHAGTYAAGASMPVTQPTEALPSPPLGGFVCLCEDVTTTEFEEAWAEGYRSTELLKRYTTATMGPCQGAMCHAHMRAFVDARPGERQEQPFSGPTTARPPARPVRVEDVAAGSRYVVEHHTALHEVHLQMGAKMSWFGSWKRPDHYGDERAEYDAVRSNVSIMDVSTLGKFRIAGPDATEFLERLYPAYISTIKPGRLKYLLVLNEAGYIFDDGLVCSLGDDGYYITFTTAGAEQGEAWLKDWAETWHHRVHIVNQTAALGAINVAGPNARALLAKVTDAPVGNDGLPFARHTEWSVASVPCRVLRLGFLGELSYELHHPSGRSVELWEALMEAGRELAVQPHGVQSLLLLRLEKGHIVVGMDTDFDTSPASVGMEWAVKMDKEYFVGRTALERLSTLQLERKLVGITFPGDTAPPEGTTLATTSGNYLGFLSSSRYSPALDCGVALAWVRLINGDFPRVVDAEGRRGKVTTVPFYDPAGDRIRA